jgi:hypothetical protein
MTMTTARPTDPHRLPDPLLVAPDMAPLWRNYEDAHFDDVAQSIVRAHQLDGEARDLPLLDLRAWGIVPCENRFALASLATNHPPKVLRANAFAHLMTRLGAPTEFLRDRLPAPLQLATANYLLASQERALPALLRLRGTEVSAIVTERYAPLDHEELLGTIRASLADQGALDSVEVKSAATGLVDIVRLVFPAEQQAIKVGDVSAVGIDISTSSFGKSALHVRGMVWRLVCTNGLRAAERQGSYSFRHVGDTRRLRDGLAEAIPTALMQARGVMDRWRTAVNVMVHDVQKQIEALRELTIPERGRLEEEVKREAGTHRLPERLDLYTFLNAVTRTAHDSVPARRLELETLAGELLDAKVRS